MNKHIFYAMPHSLYSAKARSYLIKQHIDFEEWTAGHPRYNEKVMPETGRWIIPVMETGTGEIVQDGAAIIDHYEAQGGTRMPAIPQTPRHKIISLIFEMFGGEGLLRPAMHYRWNFDEHNIDFINDQFALFALPQLPLDQRLAIIGGATGKMRKAAVGFGVVPETFTAVESGYEAFLQDLNNHFLAHPYLLGGVPTIGDYGLIAPLYAHLGRDPYPATMMKQQARAVYRWTERMNSHLADMSEFIDYPEAPIADDEVPDTLITLMRRVATDYVPELEAMTAFQNEWFKTNDVKQGDPVGGDDLVRAIGFCQFDWNGAKFSAMVMPYRFYLLQRIQDAFDGLNDADQTNVRQILDQTGLAPFITCRTTRRVERHNNREVWGALA